MDSLIHLDLALRCTNTLCFSSFGLATLVLNSSFCINCLAAFTNTPRRIGSSAGTGWSGPLGWLQYEQMVPVILSNGSPRLDATLTESWHTDPLWASVCEVKAQREEWESDVNRVLLYKGPFFSVLIFLDSVFFRLNFSGLLFNG